MTEYSIRSVSDFVKKAYKEFPDSLFIITGDHFDRSYPDVNRTIYTSTSIPLIIYGSGVEEYKLKYTAGSHKDIVPTIVEMTAPAGFKYHSFGESLLSKDVNNTDNERTAFGAQSIANGRFIYNGSNIQYFNNQQADEKDKQRANDLWEKKKAGEALSWYIVNKGYEVNK